MTMTTNNKSKRGIKRKSLNIDETESKSLLQQQIERTTTVLLLGEEQQQSQQQQSQQQQPRRVSNPFRQLNHDNDTATTKTISSLHNYKQIKISSILPVLNSGTSNTATINVLSNDNDDYNDDDTTSLLDEEASYLRGLLRPCSAFSYDDDDEEEEEDKEEDYNSNVEDSKWTFLQKGIITHHQDQIVEYKQYYDYSNIVDDEEEEDIYVTNTSISSRYYNDYEEEGETEKTVVAWDDIVNETLNDMETLHLRIKYYNNKKYNSNGKR